MITELVTAPIRDPVTLTFIKDHLRIDLTMDEQDELIKDYITAATRYAENLLGRKLISQTWKYYRQQWPNADWFSVPYPPLISVTSVKYNDSDETANTFSSGDYLVDNSKHPGRVVLGYGKNWPTETLSPKNPIYVQYTCGYGTDPKDVPMDIRLGIAQMVGHYYESREAYISGQFGGQIQEVPDAVHRLLDQYRINRFGLC